jgi:hypothetical protein
MLPFVLLACVAVVLTAVGLLAWGAVAGLVDAARDAWLEMAAIRARRSHRAGSAALPTVVGDRPRKLSTDGTEATEAMWHRMQGTARPRRRQR